MSYYNAFSFGLMLTLAIYWLVLALEERSSKNPLLWVVAASMLTSSVMFMMAFRSIAILARETALWALEVLVR